MYWRGQSTLCSSDVSASARSSIADARALRPATAESSSVFKIGFGFGTSPALPRIFTAALTVPSQSSAMVPLRHPSDGSLAEVGFQLERHLVGFAQLLHLAVGLGHLLLEEAVEQLLRIRDRARVRLVFFGVQAKVAGVDAILQLFPQFAA